jgi:hypothetical protein
VGNKADVEYELIRWTKKKKKIRNYKMTNKIFNQYKDNKKETNHSNIISFIRIFTNNDLFLLVSFNLNIKLDVFISKSFPFSSKSFRIICFFRFGFGFL